MDLHSNIFKLILRIQVLHRFQLPYLHSNIFKLILAKKEASSALSKIFTF